MNHFVFLVAYVCFVMVMFLATVSDYDCYAITPKQLYDNNDVNMFACVLLSVFILVTDPLLVALRFLRWIFHVGRNGGNY